MLNVAYRALDLMRGFSALPVIAEMAAQLALATQHFAVQGVTFNVADGFAVDIDLMQMAGTIVQVVDDAPVWQGGADAVAQFIIGVLQLAKVACLFDYFTARAVAKLQIILNDSLLAFLPATLGLQQLPDLIVTIACAGDSAGADCAAAQCAAAGVFADEPPEQIAL